MSRTRADLDDDLIDDLQRRTFMWFVDHTDPLTGLTPDRTPSRPFSSVAAIGFGLTAYVVGSERGWINRLEGAERSRLTARFLLDRPQGDAAEGVAGHRGFFYHFLDDDGLRFGGCELSSVDTALLLAGLLCAATYFDGADEIETDLRAAVDELYGRVDWSFLQSEPPLVSMGWTPERGTLPAQWRGYNEAMLVYLLALGSPTRPVDDSAWDAWTATYDRAFGDFYGQRYLAFGPQFGHQYSHTWVDFGGIRDRWNHDHDLDYAENSRRATLAQHAYAIDNPAGWTGYSGSLWGLTACDGPGDGPLDVEGVDLDVRGYSARGVGLTDVFDDGTLAPTAAVASLPFAPEVVGPTISALHDWKRGRLYGRYGFVDAFNPTVGWVASEQLGIDQGPIVAMIENHRSGLVWSIMKRCEPLRRGLTRAGFTGGWLADPAP